MTKENRFNKTHTIMAIAVLCQDFALEDEELMQNNVIKDNLGNLDFWYDVGEKTMCAIEGSLFSKNRKGTPSTLDFIMDINNRIEINDIILQSLQVFVKNYNMEMIE